MIKGSCHCGNIQLSIPELTETATSCNCSICSRYGAIWGYFDESEVEVTVGSFGIHSYCHGDRSINFNRCSQCGCMTHYTMVEKEPDSKLAVNYRMFPSDLTAQLHIRLFDGADTWSFIGE